MKFVRVEKASWRGSGSDRLCQSVDKAKKTSLFSHAMRQPILQLTPSQAAATTKKLGLQPPSGRTFQKLVSDRSL
ncbi:hypothetical protein [Coleofasciculus sp. H7-2]|uniref:hypothetical protein n=1 Tax=Coleofasciculus sp. H7-2 TaxID=3351545 RepID=UPI0036733F99